MIFIAFTFITFLFWHVYLTENKMKERFIMVENSQQKLSINLTERIVKENEKLQKQLNSLHIKVYDLEKELMKIKQKDDDDDDDADLYV